MTTIIGKKNGNDISIVGDLMMNNNGIKNLKSTKVLQLDNVLFGKAGDSLSNKLVYELYESYKEEGYSLKDISSCIGFFNYIKANCNIINYSTEDKKANITLMFLSQEFQIQIDPNGQVTELEEGGILAIGSGSDIAMILNKLDKQFNLQLSPKQYFDKISSIDLYTSKDFNGIGLIDDLTYNII